MKLISIIIPCHNEQSGIGYVLNDIPYAKLQELGYQAQVVVVDNRSTDKTAKIALSQGATVIFEKRLGKGNALKAGFRYVKDTADYIVVIDGDNTYKSQEIPRLIEPLESGFCDVVTGSRMGGKILRGSLTFSHRLVNWFFAFLVRSIYLANITDTLTGFFAFRRDVLEKLIPYLQADDFAIEMEIITKLRRLGYSIYSVPITYDRRQGKSKLHSIADGLKIALMMNRNLTWDPEGRTLAKRISKYIFELMF